MMKCSQQVFCSGGFTLHGRPSLVPSEMSLPSVNGELEFEYLTLYTQSCRQHAGLRARPGRGVS